MKKAYIIIGILILLLAIGIGFYYYKTKKHGSYSNQNNQDFHYTAEKVSKENNIDENKTNTSNNTNSNQTETQNNVTNTTPTTPSQNEEPPKEQNTRSKGKFKTNFRIHNKNIYKR